MTEVLDHNVGGEEELTRSASGQSWRQLLSIVLAGISGVLVLIAGVNYFNATPDAPLVADSTLGELSVWMAGQAERDNPPSLLGGWAKQQNISDSSVLIAGVQNLLMIWTVAIVLLIGAGILGLLRRAFWTRAVFIAALLATDVLLFIFPVISGDFNASLILFSIAALLLVLFFAPGKATRFVGFVVSISALLVAWQLVKAGAAAINYAVEAPAPSYSFSAYVTLDAALNALETGEVDAVVADRRDLQEFIPAAGSESATDVPRPTLRHLGLPSREQFLIFPVVPDMPGRLNVAVRAEDAERFKWPSHLVGVPLGAVAGDFAADRFLALPRSLRLLDLQIFNDLNLPHLQRIFEAFMQPARRNGDYLLARILSEAGLVTWQEALLGFLFGVTLGLVLGTAFAHFHLMERALLPYVVASQTVPILAIAPMVVIWLGPSPTSVAVIAAYITFFPVTINTLRGLQSPNPMAVELMQSYAASRWTILWKLRFPAALPYIFAALKVSATASVVGAVIGELPSGISGGLGRAILDFSSDYSLISTPKLWAAIITAASVGVIFFLIVSLIERLVLRCYVRGA